MLDKTDLPIKLRNFVDKYNIQAVPTLKHDSVFPFLRSEADESTLLCALHNIPTDTRFSDNQVIQLLLVKYVGSRWNLLSTYNATVSANLNRFFPSNLSAIIKSYVNPNAEMTEPDIDKEERTESNHDEESNNTKRCCSLM